MEMEELKKEIHNTETAFEKMAKKDGIKNAFLHFAAEEAVLKRGDQLFKGKQQIEAYFDDNQQIFNTADLAWTPDFIDISQSGDLAYTYGKYTINYRDQQGKTIKDNGFFHTIWKRQNDGRWLFVWD